MCEVKYPRGVTEFKHGISWGYHGDIDLDKCSSCGALTGLCYPSGFPAFCSECGAISFLEHHSLRTQRPTDPAEVTMRWDDPEDGVLWECGACSQSFFAGNSPKWCPGCGRPFIREEK